MVRIIPIQSIEESYKFIAKIGEGSSGVVYKAVSHRTNNIRAIKCISKNKQPTVTSTLEMEFAILKTLVILTLFQDHPNIVKMYEILESPTDLYIATELCDGVELFDLLMKVKKFP
jgi:serine/threonine protein kinase